MTRTALTGAQLPLDLALPSRPARGREAFRVAPSNEAAARLIDGWRGWPGGALALHGPEGSGKTHLALVFCDLSGAERVAAARLRAEDAPALLAAGAVAVEDADRMAGDRAAEAALFHLANLARAGGAALLVTGRAAPRLWPVATPDLASRLQAMLTAALEPPDDALLAALLAKHFADRRLLVGEEVIRWLARRIDRSAAAAAETAARLDAAALAAGRPITVGLARDVVSGGLQRRN